MGNEHQHQEKPDENTEMLVTGQYAYPARRSCLVKRFAALPARLAVDASLFPENECWAIPA